MTSPKITEGLKDALAGDLARVTIDGVTWVREDAEAAALLASAKRYDAACAAEWAATNRWMQDVKPTGLATAVPEKNEAEKTLLGAARAYATRMRKKKDTRP